MKTCILRQQKLSRTNPYWGLNIIRRLTLENDTSQFYSGEQIKDAGNVAFKSLRNKILYASTINNVAESGNLDNVAWKGKIKGQEAGRNLPVREPTIT